MATIRLELPDRQAEALKARAEANGLTLEQWLIQVASDYIAVPPEADLQRTDPEEWVRRFRQWAESHDRTTPLLSDDDISRESIYHDRW